MNVKPAKQLRLPLKFKGDALAPESVSERPVGKEQLMLRWDYPDCSPNRLNQPNRLGT